MPNKATPQSAAPRHVSSASGTGEGAVSRPALRSVALLLARHEIRHLKRWFEEFDRDILLPILLGEIALHNIGVFENGKNRGEPDRSGDDAALGLAAINDECELKPCNAYSIAAATGLPRETVRRKIVRLVELGWITRRDNGHLFITPRALKHFGSMLSARELNELLDTADRARRLLAAK
jgi:hypothetical protein